MLVLEEERMQRIIGALPLVPERKNLPAIVAIVRTNARIGRVS